MPTNDEFERRTEGGPNMPRRRHKYMDGRNPRRRPAHPQGVTLCAYSSDGARLVTVGTNDVVRVYDAADDFEPINIDFCQEQSLAVTVAADFCVVGSEDGTVSRYDLAKLEFEGFLYRCLVPVRDVVLSPDTRWCAIASDELSVKLVDTADNTIVRTLTEHSRPTRRLVFNPKGDRLALSGADGIIYVYSLAADRPELIHRIDAVIAAVGNARRPDARALPSCQLAWHPDGHVLAAATVTYDIQVVSAVDGAKQYCFADGHLAEVTAVTWSPNGALLASASRDGRLLLWETASRTVIENHTFSCLIVAIAWHPTENLLTFTSFDGEVYIFHDFVSEQFVALSRLPLQTVPPFRNSLGETLANTRRQPEADDDLDEGGKRPDRDIVDLSVNIRRRPDGDADVDRGQKRPRRDSLRSIKSFLNAYDAKRAKNGINSGHDPEVDGEDGGLSDFVVDDDGAGYAAPERDNGRKRPAVDELEDNDFVFGDHSGVETRIKRRQTGSVRLHAAFQPGSTPWRGNRKYLCLNLIGFVWTVDQDTHHTVTVEFYDHALHRDFHFTDTFRYDKACLTHHGTLFACPPLGDDYSTLVSVLYRPHESWTHGGDWRITLPRGEVVVAMSLTDSFIGLTASAGYVRIYSLFGVPLRVYRPKNCPPVSCASWRDVFLTMGNGPAGADGVARLVYSIEDLGRDEFCQSEDTVALPPGATLKSVFFSDEGEPCIYDSTGTLLTLLHWRQPSKAVWVPILDTKLLDRLASGRKHESYYPVAVAENKFHCIILKGGEKYPYFPRPILSEFPFRIPISSGLQPDEKSSDDTADGAAGDDDSDERAEARRLEQQLVFSSLLAAQARDTAMAGSGRAEAAAAAQLARHELDVDKTLLQLLAKECRAGEEQGPRALELVGLMRDRSGRMMEAAGKVAARYGRTVLGEKIRDMAERRVGADGEDDGLEEDGAL